ncbi:MAG: dienelactone hydrolase family protein [Nitrospiria bacterium]
MRPIMIIAGPFVMLGALMLCGTSAAAGPGDDAAGESHPLRTAVGKPNGQSITATVGSVQLTGYLARPAGAGPFPGVIMIHEWWGLNPQIKETADRLAKEGYVVLAPDLYHGKVATDAKTAGEYMNAVDPADAKATLKAAYQWVKEQPTTRGKKIGSVGWCMGGGWSLQLGLNEPVDAVVVYYGLVEKDPAVLKNLKGPVLGIFANKDGWITPEMANGFEQGLKIAKIVNQIHRYDADHAFANPSNPNYQSEMATDAWKKTLAFFKTNLR